MTKTENTTTAAQLEEIMQRLVDAAVDRGHAAYTAADCTPDGLLTSDKWSAAQARVNDARNELRELLAQTEAGR